MLHRRIASPNDMCLGKKESTRHQIDYFPCILGYILLIWKSFTLFQKNNFQVLITCDFDLKFLANKWEFRRKTYDELNWVYVRQLYRFYEIVRFRILCCLIIKIFIHHYSRLVCGAFYFYCSHIGFKFFLKLIWFWQIYW